MTVNRLLGYLKKMGSPKNSEEQESVIYFGNWTLQMNPPFGFVVRNKLARESYHFYAESNGWITGEWAIGRPDELATCTAFNSMGSKLSTPVLVDKKSLEKAARIKSLREKDFLSDSEKEELLILSGLRK